MMKGKKSASASDKIRRSQLMAVYSDDHNVEVPRNILYKDYLFTRPIHHVDLRGYRLNQQAFEDLSGAGFHLTHLNLDNCTNFHPNWFSALRAKLSLKVLCLESQKF